MAKSKKDCSQRLSMKIFRAGEKGFDRYLSRLKEEWLWIAFASKRKFVPY